jgi:hypothetical protein
VPSDVRRQSLPAGISYRPRTQEVLAQLGLRGAAAGGGPDFFYWSSPVCGGFQHAGRRRWLVVSYAPSRSRPSPRSGAKPEVAFARKPT